MSTLLPTYMKRKLFSELRDRVDAGTRCPSLAWIVKFCRLSNVHQAEQLLRQMERDAVIDVLRMGPYPWVSILRDTYSGVKIAGMTLDPERFDKFEDGNDVLVVKAAPEPRVLPKGGSASDELEDEDDEPPVPRIARPTRVAPLTPELPTVETVSAKQEIPDAGNPSPAEQDQGPTAVAPPACSSAVVAEVENEPVIPRPQSVEARHDPQGGDHDGREADGIEHQRRADGEQCDAPRLPGADGRGKAIDAEVEGRRPVVLEPARPAGDQPRTVDCQDEDRGSGDVGCEAPDSLAVVEPEVPAAPPAPKLSLWPDVKAFIALHNMAPTRFGKLANVGMSFVQKLRDGASTSAKVEKRVRAFMESYASRPALPEPKPRPVAPVVSKPVPAQVPRTRAVTFHVTAEEFATLQKRAKADDVQPGRAAYNIFLEGLSGTPAPAPAALPKPRIPAAVMTALRNDGRPFDQFIADLLALGLEQYLAFRRGK